ncbi:TPA: hypothetical protein ACWZIR_004812, partial [Escherichia coli]
KNKINFKICTNEKTRSETSRTIFSQQFMIVRCKPHYTRLCESDVKVKKVRIALLSYFSLNF